MRQGNQTQSKKTVTYLTRLKNHDNKATNCAVFDLCANLTQRAIVRAIKSSVGVSHLRHKPYTVGDPIMSFWGVSDFIEIKIKEAKEAKYD